MANPPSIDPATHALFLDFDGTLVDLVDDPDAVAIAPDVLRRLTDLRSELCDAFGIVSGRRISDLDRFLHPLRFAAAGVHGLERREAPDGDIQRLAGPEALDSIREALRAGIARHPSLKLEDKGTALVLHYREHPSLEAQARQLMQDAAGNDPAFAIMHGNMIVEVHLSGMDKGQALRTFMENANFRGRLPIYVGDDTTDEFGFRAVRELGGVSIKVGKGESDAQFRLADVEAVHRWLAGDTVGSEKDGISA